MSHGLNTAQAEAVGTLSGPLLVLAAAGTGKTRVITYRIANLIRHGTPPERILAVTFTNKAAREMRERATSLLGSRSPSKPVIGTFHSLCVRILREDVDRLGYSKFFAICDSGDQETLARRTLRDQRIDPKDITPTEFLQRVGAWKNAGLRSARVRVSDEIRSDEKDRIAAKAYPAYESALRSAGVLDFDDLLLCTEELFREHSDVREKHRRRYDHVLVDEYQDTNAIQYRILRHLAAEHRNLCVVGDDDQSIYGWRGAQVENLKRLERDFPGTKIVRLEQNYRSCPNILRLANQLIRHNPGRYAKELKGTRPARNEARYWKLKDEQEEAAAVVRDIAVTRATEKLSWRDFAILFRTNEQPRLFEGELRSRSIPYTLVGGYSFFDRREIRDVLAYLRVVTNPNDEVSLLRIVNTPPRGLGSTVVERLVTRAAQSGQALWDTLTGSIEDPNQAGRARAGAERLIRVIDEGRRMAESGRLAEMTRRLLETVGYRSEISRHYDDPREQSSRWDTVGEMLNMLASYEERTPRPTLQGFLDGIALATEQDKGSDDKDRDAVTLMTLHCAKGLEFPHVYLVGMEQGILPHERSLASAGGIEEERRLAYVGVTRARDRLTMSRALARRKFGQWRPTTASQFLPEMYGAANEESQVDRLDNGSDQSRTPKAKPVLAMHPNANAGP